MRNPLATFFIQDEGKITVELRPDAAPNTVRSFLYLASMGLYNGHALERLVPGFVADMSYTAFHRPEARYLIPYETKDAGFPNPLPATPGMIVMGGYDQGIAGGEFFFLFEKHERITWHYPAFGQVIQGWEIIEGWNHLPVKIVDFPQDPSVTITAPLNPPVILRCDVETFGVSYPPPVRLENVPIPANWLEAPSSQVVLD